MVVITDCFKFLIFQGWIGEKGAKGEHGVPGARGLAGLPGLDGMKGIKVTNMIITTEKVQFSPCYLAFAITVLLCSFAAIIASATNL